MKKTLLTLLFSGLVLITTAQNDEWQFGLGFGSFQEIAVRNQKHPLYEVVQSYGESNVSYVYSATGPIRIGYRSHENKHFLLGADFSYTNNGVQTKSSSGKISNSNFYHYTLMASTSYKYIDNPNLVVYSGVDFGVCYMNAKNQETERKINTITAAYQLNFVGIRYGQKLGGFAELGMGFNGFLSGGIFYRVF
jgi:hypothetical protein